MKKIIVSILIFTLAIFQAAFAKEAQGPLVMEHNKKGIYVFKIDTNKIGNKIKPYVAENLTTVSDIFKAQENLELVVNGGFFDPATGGAISFVTVDGVCVESPFSNLGLMQDLQKANRLEAVLNRGEFRILEDSKGRLSFDIANHFTPVEKNKTIKHSLQAGPIIYPRMDLEKESFIIMKNDKIAFQAADVLKRRERTALGIKNKNLYLIIFTKQNKVTLSELKNFCEKMKLDKAMAFDGGASTSLNYKDVEIFSSAGSQRRVKSFLTIEK